MNYNIDSLLKAHSFTLTSNMISYFENDDTFMMVSDEINNMLIADISIPIIYAYILTTVLMIKVVKKYDLVSNYKKIDRLLALIFPFESERKKYLIQTLAYCIKASSAPNCTPEVMKAMISDMINVVNQ